MKSFKPLLLLVILGIVLLSACENDKQSTSEPISVKSELKTTFTGPIGINVAGVLSLTETQSTLKEYFMARYGKGLSTIFVDRKFEIDTIYLTTAPVEIEGKPVYLAIDGRFKGAKDSKSFGGSLQVIGNGDLFYLQSTLKGMEAEPIPLRGCVGDKCGFCTKKYNEQGVLIGCNPCSTENCQKVGECFCNWVDVE